MPTKILCLGVPYFKLSYSIILSCSIFRYSEGVHCFFFLNMRLKVGRLEKPDCSATSVIGMEKEEISRCAWASWQLIT